MKTQQDSTALTGNPIIRHKYTSDPAVLVYEDVCSTEILVKPSI